MPHVGAICIIWMPEKWYTTFLHQQAPILLVRFLRLFDLCRGIYEIYCPIWQVSLVIRSDLQDASAHASFPPSAAGKALSRCSRHGASRQIDGVGGKCYNNPSKFCMPQLYIPWFYQGYSERECGDRSCKILHLFV